ncbi:MAG: IPT/TIG domain-containing protein, partial [Acidobacteria bacterium]|nr:IPT/TIG domain-containing protein [Acidobacteriota bacterium]
GQLDPFPGTNRYGDVWGEGNYAYLGSFSGLGVTIIDISNPAAPQMAGYYNPPSGGRFQDVIVIDSIGYFSSENNGGVHIVDVRDPANPTLLSQLTTDRNGYPFVHEIFVADGILYEADSRTNRVRAFNVRNPRDPLFVREIVTTDPRFIHAIVVINGRLYSSGWGGKTDIYDVRNILTEEPRLLGAVDSGNNSHSSWVSSDGRLLASARETLDGDVRLFDISDPANPRLLSSITSQSLGITAYTAHNPYIVGNLLFISWYQAGLVVVDITDPTQPRLAGSYDTFAGEVSGFAGCWGVYPFLGLDRVLLGDMDGGLFIIDATTAIVGPKTVSAASYKVSAIASKTIVAAFGTNLSSAIQAADSALLPTSLAGTIVQVQDSIGSLRLAPLYYVSPTQINFQIPAGTAPGPATLYVTAGQARPQIGAMIIAPTAPSLFTLDQSGNGAAAAIDAFTSSGAPFNATRNDGQPNIIAIYGSGLGEDATDIDGNVNASVQVRIDGQPVTVHYAGRAPLFVGLNQLNVEFPAGISSGNHNLVVTRNGVSSNVVTFEVR